MDLKRVTRETTKTLISYLTYQAVRTIIDQLSETNPPLALWFRQYSTGDKLQDGDRYLHNLFRERKDLALRVMAVREHLADSVVDILPEMVRAGIQQQNMEHRRQLLERMTQTQSPETMPPSEPSHPELKPDQPPLRDERGTTD